MEKLKIGTAFTLKGKRSKTYLVTNVHRNGDISCTHESNTYRNYNGKVIVELKKSVFRIEKDAIETMIAEIVESSYVKMRRNVDRIAASKKRIAETSTDHVDAISMDILLNVARGADVAVEMERLTVLLSNVADDAYNKGVEKGYDDARSGENVEPDYREYDSEGHLM